MLFRVAGAVAAASVLLASGCGAASHAGSRTALAAAYLRIANAGNHRLEADFDGLEGPDRRDLAAARADLRDAAATEHLFDRRLMAMRFPPATERIARALFQLNEARARLTAAAAAAATSLTQLHAYEQLLDSANVPVEQQVRAIRRQLGLPPPETS
jgi:HrpA-like RNA helicase